MSKYTRNWQLTLFNIFHMSLKFFWRSAQIQHEHRALRSLDGLVESCTCRHFWRAGPPWPWTPLTPTWYDLIRWWVVHCHVMVSRGVRSALTLTLCCRAMRWGCSTTMVTMTRARTLRGRMTHKAALLPQPCEASFNLPFMTPLAPTQGQILNPFCQHPESKILDPHPRPKQLRNCRRCLTE